MKRFWKPVTSLRITIISIEQVQRCICREAGISVHLSSADRIPSQLKHTQQYTQTTGTVHRSGFRHSPNKPLSQYFDCTCLSWIFTGEEENKFPWKRPLIALLCCHIYYNFLPPQKLVSSFIRWRNTWHLRLTLPANNNFIKLILPLQKYGCEKALFLPGEQQRFGVDARPLCWKKSLKRKFRCMCQLASLAIITKNGYPSKQTRKPLTILRTTGCFTLAQIIGKVQAFGITHRMHFLNSFSKYIFCQRLFQNSFPASICSACSLLTQSAQFLG